MITLATVLFVSSAYAAVETAPKVENCQATREFVTALEFLRNDENFRLKDVDGKDIAMKISTGCKGSASRFIRVAKLLLKAGANRKDATEEGLKFATGTDAEADAFVTAFRKSLAEDGLDLDL